MIPLCDLKLQYHQYKDEIDAAMQQAAEQARYILGPNVKQLEQDVADYCQCQFGVGVASGTDALHLALRALEIGPGDEVITTPFTFVATTEAIGMVGATPVFVDIDPQTFNINTAAIEAAITPKTKAILPVHLYGQPCDMDHIMDIAGRHNLFVVEDNAQSFGAEFRGRKAGSFGHAGCLSFFPSKNLGAFGDGGMVVTNDQRVAERAEMLRRHGGKVKYYHDELGLNSRLDELQAAILRVKLPRIDQWNRQRREAALAYNERLAEVQGATRPHELTVDGPMVPLDENKQPNVIVRSVYHQYTIQVDRRDDVAAALKAREIGNAVYYPIPLHLQKVHAHLGCKPGDFPVAEQVATRCLSLPIFPGIQTDQIDQVVDALRDAIRESGADRVDRAA